MKAGTSSLNPYAASYIPLSRRGAAVEEKDSSLGAKDTKSNNETVMFGPHYENITQNQHRGNVSQNYISQGTHSHKDYAMKGNTIQGNYCSSSHSPRAITEKQILDEEFDIDLEYLQMVFPEVSGESLSDVYLANKGDLDATIEMLYQLELYTGDSSENLPDTLDIGDVSECGTSCESVSQKLKKVAGEVAGSSSGSSESAHVT